MFVFGFCYILKWMTAIIWIENDLECKLVRSTVLEMLFWAIFRSFQSRRMLLCFVKAYAITTTKNPLTSANFESSIQQNIYAEEKIKTSTWDGLMFSICNHCKERREILRPFVHVPIHNLIYIYWVFAEPPNLSILYGILKCTGTSLLLVHLGYSSNNVPVFHSSCYPISKKFICIKRHARCTS